ncbi:hypothetical protein ACFLSQ_01905 [Bacteroidota bacterium]
MKTTNQKKDTIKKALLFVRIFFFVLYNPLNLYCADADLNMLNHVEANENRFQGYIGLSVTMIPREIVEEEIAQIPMLEGRLNYKVNDNLSVHSRLMTNYLTNSLSLGVSWTQSWKDFSISAGDMTEAWFGIAQMDGFDATSYGLANYPSVSMDVKLADYTVKAKVEGIIFLTQESTIGNTSFKDNKEPFTGMIFSLSLQQSLWKDNDLELGVKLNYTEPSHHVWLAFSEMNEWMLYPQLSMGYSL